MYLVRVTWLWIVTHRAWQGFTNKLTKKWIDGQTSSKFLLFVVTECWIQTDWFCFQNFNHYFCRLLYIFNGSHINSVYKHCYYIYFQPCWELQLLAIMWAKACYILWLDKIINSIRIPLALNTNSPVKHALKWLKTETWNFKNWKKSCLISTFFQPINPSSAALRALPAECDCSHREVDHQQLQSPAYQTPQVMMTPQYSGSTIISQDLNWEL